MKNLEPSSVSFPLTFPQREIFVDQSLHPGEPLYNIGGYMRLEGPLNIERFRQSLAFLWHKHDALRTVFMKRHHDDVLPAQSFAEHIEFDLAIHDLTQRSEPNEDAMAWMRQSLHEPFDLNSAATPLFRYALLKVGHDSYYCFVCYHHLIADGWCVALLARSMAAIYNALEAGEAPDLSALSYQEFIADDLAYRGSANYEKQRQYWLEKFSVVPEPLFTMRYPDAAKPGMPPSRCSVLSLERHYYDELVAFAATQGVSILHVLLGALYVYFTRTVQRDELAIGLPVLNRSNAAHKATAGLFVNVSPARFRFGSDIRFGDLLQEISRELRGNYRNQRFPISELAAEVFSSDSSRRTLFDLSISFKKQNYDVAFGETGGAVSAMINEHQYTPLTLWICEFHDDEPVQIEFVFNRAYFALDEIKAIQQRFLGILDFALLQPGAKVKDIPLLTEQEYKLAIVDWNATAQELPEEDTLAHLFEEQAAKRADAIAVVCESQTLTYGELNRRANRLAHYLRAAGVGPETPVGIHVERSAVMIVAMLAVLKAGGAYVPLDPAYPEERLAYMLEDAKPDLVLTQESVATRLPAVEAPLFRIDSQWAELDAYPDTDMAHPTLPANLAYVNYTSGSSGKPKSVGISHNAVKRLVFDTEYLPLREDDKVAQAANSSFDATTFEVWSSLLHGCQLHIIPYRAILSPLEFANQIRYKGITTLFITTALFNQFAHIAPQAFGKLRHLLFGGESVDTRSVQAILRHGRPERLLHVYGPTESTTFSSWYSIADLPEGAQTVPIGRPILNTQFYVLDARLKAVPPGVSGELYIGGEGLARGYLNRPAMTAEKFVPNPFSIVPGSRMYKTGDIVRYLADGNVEYLDRADRQVKVRGFRIELAEVEAGLLANAAIKDAVVLAKADESGAKRLIAYVVPHAGFCDITVSEMRSSLRQTLPDYMVPSHILLLDALPLTRNGKVDRNALPAPELAKSEDDYVAPQSENERLLADIWSEVLQRPAVSVRDNFFALGGHSLLAITLIERMRRAGLQVDIRALFANPTIAGLAATIHAEEDGQEDLPSNGIAADCRKITPAMLTLVKLNDDEIGRIVATVEGGDANIQDIYPLAPLQDGILLHHLTDAKDDPYLISLSLRFGERDHADRFLDALHKVIARHDILRTAIAWEGLPEPVQVVWRQAPMRVDVIGTGEALAEPQRMDLRHAPLIRAAIQRDAGDMRCNLRITLHHVIGDFKTLERLIGEAMTIVQGREDLLPKPTPFRDFIARRLRDDGNVKHEAFFRDMLSDVDEPTAPFGLLEGQGEQRELAEARHALDLALTQRIRQRARALGVGTASLMHLAWALVLGRITGRRDAVFGTVMLGRADGADSAMGIFINSLPIRIRLAGTSAVQALRDTHALLIQMMQHENAPLPLALRCSGVPSQKPLFSSILNYRHGSVQDVFARFRRDLAWDDMELLAVEERTRYPFSLSVEDTEEAFFLVARTDASVSPDRICDFMCTALSKLLDTLESDPDARVQAVDVLPEAERRLLLVDWNRTQVAQPILTTAAALFEEQVRRFSDETALIFEDCAISYLELNQRANRLAHYLREFGIGPDDLVGICMERSIDMIVAVLGVLKAGGAYLPLDPAVPEARLAYMIDDAAPCFMLTQEHLYRQLPKLACGHLCLDRSEEQLATRSPENPPRSVQPDHLAYVIYTSGSTGKPKGVLLYHRALVNLVLAQVKAFGVAPQQRVLQWASFNFDVSVSDIFTALCAGATLCLASREAVMPGMDLWNTLRRHRVELVAMTASALAALPQDPLPDLKTLVVGGEQLDESIIAPWLKKHNVINVYGPTEATVCAVLHPCAPDGVRQPPIGRPIANTEAYVLDRWFRPVPIGAVGELYLGGEGLARGYLNRPDLTAERFIQNPYSAQPGARMYKTGDLVRYLPNGNIAYLGRADRQVKIRGYRIEPGEIEFALAQLPAVREAAVIVQAASADLPFLVAYVAPVAGSLDADALRLALGENLPEYMIPAHFVAIEKLPVGTNGKIDRIALESIPWAKAEEVFDAPATPTEKALAAIWADLIGCERVARNDDFFNIGGHSLLLVKLIARIKREFGVTMAISQVLSASALSAFALVLDGALPRPSLCIALQKNPSGVPLFFMHPSGGTVFAYEKLARRISHAGPVHAIQSPEIAGLDIGDYDFDALCRRYAEEIATVCPFGTVRVAGWSMGGMLALGVTAILERSGRKVEQVAMFDTHPPRGDAFADMSHFLQLLLDTHDAIPGAGGDANPALQSAYDRLRGLVQQHGLPHVADKLADSSAQRWLEEQGLEASAMEFLRSQYTIQRRHFLTMKTFVPASVDAPIHLVWAESELADGVPPRDWLAYSKDRLHSTQRILPGNHASVIQGEANQAVIAELLTGNPKPVTLEDDVNL